MHNDDNEYIVINHNNINMSICLQVVSLAMEENIQLSEKHLDKLVTLLELVMTHWWTIGKQLGLSSIELLEVKASTDSENEQFRQMLKIWLTGTETVPTLRALCVALEGMRLHGMATELMYQCAHLNSYTTPD